MANTELSTLPASFLSRIATDPARRVPGAPPGFGREVLPHIFSVAGRVGTVSHSYPWYDEALRDSRANAEIMRTETGIMECVEARKRGTALLKWHVEPRDSKDEAAKDLASKVTMILEETKQFMDLRNCLMEAIWYGRYLTSHRYLVTDIGGTYRQYIGGWTPRHGDKIVFRYDDGIGTYLTDQIGIRISTAFEWQSSEVAFNGARRDKIETTSQFGRVYWLDPHERMRVALHKHLIEDGEFYDPRDMGRVNGVGVRDRIYWTWYMMQETLANAMDFIERNSHGIEIWRFPAGNPEAEARTVEAAKNRSNKAVLLVPVQPGEMADLQTVEVIEPGFAGLDALMGLITTFFSHKIKRYILGQVLTSEAAATGLGSGVADAHMATYSDIIRFDALKLEETVTTDIVRPVQLYNFPQSAHIKLLFRLDTEAEDMESKLGAWKAAWEMGAKIPALDLLGLIGARMPDEDEVFLQNMALDTEVQTAQLGQQMQAQQQQQAMQQQQMAMANNPAIQTQANGNPAPGQPGGQRQPSTTATFGPMSAIDQGQKSKHSLTAADIDAAAKSAHPDPSDPQRAAGNYQMGHVRIHGLDVTIETPKGQRRKPQWPPMAAHYGYIKSTEGKDGDHVDVFLGEHPSVEVVFVLDQHKGPLSRRFDEHKVFLGFRNEHEAMQAYRASYDSAPGGPVTALSVPAFKAWLEEGNTKDRIAPQISKYAAKWDESLHPRRSDGKFAPKGGGQSRRGAAVGSDKGVSQAPTRQLPANLKPRHARKIAKIEAKRDRHLAQVERGFQRDMEEYWPEQFAGMDMDEPFELESWETPADARTPNDILNNVRKAHAKYVEEINAKADARIQKILSRYPQATTDPQFAVRGKSKQLQQLPDPTSHTAKRFMHKLAARRRVRPRNQGQMQALQEAMQYFNDNPKKKFLPPELQVGMSFGDRIAYAKTVLPEMLKRAIMMHAAITAGLALGKYLGMELHDAQRRGPTPGSKPKFNAAWAKEAANHMGQQTVQAVDEFYDNLEDGEQAQLHVPFDIWNSTIGPAWATKDQARNMVIESYGAYIVAKAGKGNVKWMGMDANGNLRWQIRKVGARKAPPPKPDLTLPTGLPAPAGASA